MNDSAASPALPPTGNTYRTQPENRAFFPALDGLRAVAFLMVFGQHYLSLAWGWTGVNVFFVLSGFLITGILFDSRDAPHRVRNFYLRRTLRIFPLYYGLFLLLLLLTPLLRWHWDRYWMAWPLYLGNFLRFLSPAAGVVGSPLEMAADAHLGGSLLPRSELYLGHLWSLCVEEQFYLLWPAVVFFVRDRRRLLAICAGAVVLGPLLRFGLQAFAPPWMLAEELLYRFTPAQFDALLLGGLVALLWRGPARARLIAWARIGAVLGTFAVTGYLVFVLHGWRLAPAGYPHWSFTGGLLFADLYAAAVMVCALSPGGVVFRLLHVRILRWVGRLTYGAYVFHDLFHDLFVHLVVHVGGARVAANIPLRNELAAVVALPATLLLAWFSFRFFESPFLDLKDRWTVGRETGISPLRGQ
ncbi:MAG: acyltransferase family protein [Janthinobacterium lividum]